MTTTRIATRKEEIIKEYSMQAVEAFEGEFGKDDKFLIENFEQKYMGAFSKEAFALDYIKTHCPQIIETLGAAWAYIINGEAYFDNELCFDYNYIDGYIFQN